MTADSNKTLNLIKELVKSYLEIRASIEEAKSEIIRTVLEALDIVNFRKLIREVLQEDSEHR